MDGALVGLQHQPGVGGVGAQEGVGRVEEAVAVEVDVAVDQLRALLELRLGHMGVEPGPGVHLLLHERGVAVRVLQQHRLDVLLAQPLGGKRAQQEDVRVGPAGHGDGAPLEI